MKCANDAKRTPQGVEGPASSIDAKIDRAEITTKTEEQVKTLDDLVRVCDIDLGEWRVDRWVCNKWEANAGGGATVPLFQVKAWLVRNRPVIDARAQIDALVADARQQIGPCPKVAKRTPGPHMLELSIPDLHLGKLAWGPETGHAPYDRKIARRVFFEALETLIARVAAFQFERIVFPIGNDFLNSDTKAGTTTSGTPLDNDSRYHRTYIEGRRLLTSAVDRLRALAPVTVVVVPGNHDHISAFTLGEALHCYYHKTPDVEVMNDAVPRKYVSYGRSLLMFTHGHKGKPQEYPLLMATERPEAFGQALYREAHVGHTHETRVREWMGVRVRVSPALCPPDAWHSEHHFVGNLRSAEALVWHRDEGLIAMSVYTVPHVRKEVKAA